MIDIGRVFGTGWAMMRQRFWPLLGMWAVFFAIQMAGSIVLGVGMAVMGTAGAAGLGAGLEDPTAITGLGIGFILFMVLFYGAYIVLILAQQAAMVTIASPLEDVSFGGAMARGFKSAPSFFAIGVLLMIGYFVIAGLTFGAAGFAGFGAGAAGGVVSALLLLLLLPVMVYLGCRMSVLIAVVAVDQVWGPIAAIRRSWAVTQGRVLGIFLATLAFGALTLVVFGLPFMLMFSAAESGDGDPGAGAIGMVLLGFLVMIPLFIGYTIFATAYIAALHSELTGGGAEALEEVFA